ncbi:MAG: RNA polymerase sigma factor [Bacteroidota bacterium]
MTSAAQKEIFENWLSNHKGLLFKVVRAYAFNADDQDDLFQDICIQVWASVPNFKKQSAISTWLYRIALNTTFKWIRKEKKFNKQKDQEHLGHILHDAMTESDDRLDWLYSEIKKLDEVDRSITLLMLDGYSYKEMSEMLGITTSNIGVKINRIKKHLITKSEHYEKQAS